MANEKNEAVFELIKCMSKAEKRNFKLFATRLAGNEQAKFVALFDVLDSMDEYNGERVLARCPVKKEQLPNLKAHLYRQILVSLRLLTTQHSLPMQLREQVDFARILYDKGLYLHSTKFLERVGEQALEIQQNTLALDVMDFRRNIETLRVAKGMSDHSDVISRKASELCEQITSTNELINTSVQLYDLYQKLGYARSQKDLDFLESYFGPKLAGYDLAQMPFMEQFYYYQCMAWYSYIRHDMVRSYRYTCAWVDLFDSAPSMKTLMYDNYMMGYSRLLDGLFLMRKHKTFVEKLEKFEQECLTLGVLNDNAMILSRYILYLNRINRFFSEGRFREGVGIVPQIETFLKRYRKTMSVHNTMMLYYKIACLYFGNGDYEKCMEYLNRIMGRKDPQIRRDLQCYAKILYLIASYDSGRDYNLEYQIRSVYAFLIKMNDMQQVQREMLSFLRKLGTFYQKDLPGELRILYERLKPYENHPYERRTFYYLDVLSWLESKLTGRTVAEIIRERFLKETKVKS